jgi:hypothetical protein
VTGRSGDGQDLLPLLDTGDLHEDDFAAVLADHLPDLNDPPGRTGR